MTLQIPTLLALLGTALLAVVIFAPRRPAAVNATVSYAPPVAPPVERWNPPAYDDEPPFPEPEFDVPFEPLVGWPALVDPAAAGASPDTRRQIAEALGAVRSPWALAVLERARREEPEPLVRATIDAALAS